MKQMLMGAVLCAVTSHAVAVGSLAEVTVYDRAENRTLPVYHHQGRHYVVGKPGNEYRIDIRSNHAREILAVISVDGVNAVSGETANWGQTGYVLGPHDSYGIKGWRKSLQRVAAFFFTEHESSYAARTGRPDNVGVIGVAVFRKKYEPPVAISRDYRQRREAPGPAAGDAAPAAENQARDSAADAPAPPASIAPQSAPAEKSLGTGHGKSEASIVRHTRFERATPAPDEIITIYYDTYHNLLAQGVIKDRARIARPTPFPGQFVPDPR